ncbi:hypothetical protein D3C87_1662690 [compost metagenome]
MVELRPVEPKLRLQVKKRLEDPLYVADVLAYCCLATQVSLQVRRGRQVVGMRVRLENPLDSQSMRAHKRNNLISTCRRCPTRLGVVVQHRVDDGALGAPLLKDHVRHSPGRRVEERLDSRVHARLLGCSTFYSHTFYFSI